MADPMDEARKRIREMAVRCTRNSDPAGWFDTVYQEAAGDTGQVPWADLEANPKLTAWLQQHPMVRSAGRAVTVGCGLGDDAEALASAGYQVTAFDISETAIEWCSRRFPNSRVEYKTLDLFALPEEWPGRFDLVFESNTIQALLGEYRNQALEAIARLVAPGGVVLVSCRSRDEGEKEDAFPIPLTRGDLDRFIGSGLVEDGFDAYDDDQDPPVPHYFSWYSRPQST